MPISAQVEQEEDVNGERPSTTSVHSIPQDESAAAQAGTSLDTGSARATVTVVSPFGGPPDGSPIKEAFPGSIQRASNSGEAAPVSGSLGRVSSASTSGVAMLRSETLTLPLQGL